MNKLSRSLAVGAVVVGVAKGVTIAKGAKGDVVMTNIPSHAKTNANFTIE